MRTILKSVHTFLRTRSRTEYLGLGLLLAAWVLFFSRTLLGSAVYFFDDLRIIYYPLEHVYGAFQAQWNLPQWSPVFGFGHPLLAWAQLGFLTPLHVILRFFVDHALIRLQISILFYFAAALLGMYAFLRTHRLHPLSSATGSIIFAFSGFMVGHLGHVNFFVSTLLLPWLLLALHHLAHQASRLSLLSVVAAASTIALSGQPQVILYTFLIATLYYLTQALFRLLHTSNRLKYVSIQLGVMGIAGILSFSLASLNILPLLEFLPLTERADSLPPSVLYEFSYPPEHAITLALPTFFGNHDHYWGAKNFNELAAYVGVIPLLLATLALFNWRAHRDLRTSAVILLASSVLFGLGRHSPLYTYLVENHWLTSLAVPGRFVYFFDVSIAILAAISIDAWWRHMPKRSWLWLSTAIVTAAIISLLVTLQADPLSADRLDSLWHSLSAEAAIAGSSIIGWLIGISIISLYPRHTLARRASISVLAIASIGTILALGWNYTPLMPTAVALSPPALETGFTSSTTSFPRIYARNDLIQSKASNTQRTTDYLGGDFSLIQPVSNSNPDYPCISITLHHDEGTTSSLTASLYQQPTGDPLASQRIISNSLSTEDDYEVCFDALANLNQRFYVRLHEPIQTTFRAIAQEESDEAHQAYFIRVANASPAKIEQSQKPLAILWSDKGTSIDDREKDLLIRHLNAVANISSARWIGALSIKNYRDFIETFLANDDGRLIIDDEHIISHNRSLLNFAGVTHVSQHLPPDYQDGMAQANFPLVTTSATESAGEVRLYENPEAFPKAFLVPRGEFKAAADETRHAMMEKTFNPAEYVYLNGHKPPTHLPPPDNLLGAHSVTITRYEPLQVDVDVTTEQPAILVLTDSATPQWHTYLDNTPVPSLTANTLFRAAIVPAGTHTISFRYHSPATQQAIYLTITGIVASILLLLSMAIPFPTTLGKST